MAVRGHAPWDRSHRISVGQAPDVLQPGDVGALQIGDAPSLVASPEIVRRDGPMRFVLDSNGPQLSKQDEWMLSSVAALLYGRAALSAC